MKKIVFFIIYFFVNITLNSQEILQCGEDIQPGLINENIYSHVAQRNDDNQKFFFKIFFHIIRDSNGNNVTGITPNDIQNAVEMLNVTYNQFNIFFKYAGYDYIDDNALLTIDYVSNDPSCEYRQLYNRPEYRNDAFNLFISNNVNYNGRTAAGIGARPGLLSVYRKDYFLTVTLVHEIGHNFNLYHTYHKPPCEHVNGDNCDVAGDFVCDTPAAYYVTQMDTQATSCPRYYEYVNNTQTRDCIGDLYVNVPIHNIMSNNLYRVSNYYKNIRTEVTPGQGVRMRESIQSGLYNATMVPQDSLYIPYKVQPPDIVDIMYTRQQDLAPHVPFYWYQLSNFKCTFQKGFDYEIYHWDYDWHIDNNGNIVYDNYRYTYLYSVNTADPTCSPCTNPCEETEQFINLYANIAIKIPQISDEIVPLPCSRSPIPGPPVISSTIISSDPGLQNIEQRTLDENQSNDPHLFDNLEAGKVHRIIKYLQNGETNTKNIYKEQ